MQGYTLEPWMWAAVIGSGICIGLSKTWLNGLATIMIPVVARIFGAKESTGVVLPLLCFADLIAALYYRRSCEGKYILRLLPWALAGFGLALAVDRIVPPRGFKILIGVCILAGLGVMLWNERRGAGPIPSGLLFSGVFGILGGFATMIGNAAGPIMSVYLLSMRLPKAGFVGTGAWFFLIVNYLKIPLQYFVWRNITKESLLFDAFILPAVLAGAAGGLILVKKISEAKYRRLVYGMTIISAVLLFL